MGLIQQETGVSPQSISKCGEKFTISVLGVEDKERIFQILDRERLVGGGMISVQKETNILAASEIDALMRRWLVVEDKARLRDCLQTSNPLPQTRWQREVDVQQEAKTILMRILPIEFRKKVLQEEDRKTQNTLVLSGL